MKMDGPMVSLALRHAARAWFFNEFQGAPISVRTMAELLAEGAFHMRMVYPDLTLQTTR
jgi:hypothetical protein